MKKTRLIFFALISCTLAIAQSNWCGAPTPSRAQLRTLRARPTVPYTQLGTKLYVPMTLHIIGNDDCTGYYREKAAYDAFCQLQTDFEPVDIVFYLVDIRYHCNTLYNNHQDFGVGGDMVADYSVPNTLNCFITEVAAGACAYAWPGGAIVLKNSCTTKPNHTWAHEAGHYFSLPHVFLGWEGQTVNRLLPALTTTDDGSEVELADGSNCLTAGDGFCDTPADYISDRWSCDTARRSQSLIDPTGTSFTADGNYYMSYSLDACMSKFSLEQMTAMRDFAQSNLSNLVQLTPTPYLPVAQATLNYPIDSVVTRYDTLTLSWQRDPNATTYIFEMSRQNSFQLIQTTQYTSDTSITLYNLSPGKRFLWRVRAINPQFMCAPVSVIEHFFTQPLVATQQSTPLRGKLSVAPNPTKRGENALLKWENIEKETAKLQLFSIDGRLLQEKTIYPMLQAETDIDTQNIQAGIFIVKMQTSEGSLHQKLIIQ